MRPSTAILLPGQGATRLRVIQVGAGHIGMRRLDSALRDPDVEVVGVVDVKRERLALARDRVGDRCHLDVSYHSAVQVTRPDAALLSVPVHLHAPIACDLLRAGVHVLCEKPLARTVADGERCVALARRLGLVLKVGSNHRFWRSVRELVAHFERGAIGALRDVRVDIGYVLPDERSEWYRESACSGGGTLIDNSPHAINLVEEILRLQGGDAIASVRCRTSNDALGLEVEDCAEGQLLSHGGVPISLRSTWGDGAYRMNVELVGEAGRLSLEGFERLVLETPERQRELGFGDVPPGESWALDLRSFVDAVFRRERLVGTGEEGLDNLRVISAMYDSAARGAEEVRLTPPVARRLQPR